MYVNMTTMDRFTRHNVTICSDQLQEFSNDDNIVFYLCSILRGNGNVQWQDPVILVVHGFGLFFFFFFSSKRRGRRFLRVLVLLDLSLAETFAS
jgi:hypothetical protein